MNHCSAILSDCEFFRYELARIWAPGPIASIVMVNPSTADAAKNDRTIVKLIGFGQRLGWGGFVVVNKHAFRATDVNELKRARDPLGPMNDGHILAAMLKTNLTVVAWGSLNKLPPQLRNNWRKVAAIAEALNRPLYCWGTCADGHPKHPVMIGYDNPLTQWKVPK